MPATGLYFIPVTSPNSPTAFQQITDRLTLLFNPRPLGRWTLDHKLFRETRSLVAGFEGGGAGEKEVRYLQLLTLSHRAQGFGGRGYVAVSQKPAAAAANANGTKANIDGGDQGEAPVSIVAVSNTDAFFHLVNARMNPLWVHRQTLQVVQGAGYETDDFRVRVGDLRQVQRAQIRGTVLEIEWLGGLEGEDEVGSEFQGNLEAEEDVEKKMQADEMLIRNFWESLGVVVENVSGGDGRGRQGGGVREFTRAPGVGADDLSLVRQWVELLRLRGN